MANVIYIKNINDTFWYTFPLIEDPSISIENRYSTIGDLVPNISELIGNITTINTLTSQSINNSLSTIRNVLDIPRWQGTEPIKLNIKLLFYAKNGGITSSAQEDVTSQMNYFIENAVLSTDIDGKSLVVPGLGLDDAGKAAQGKKATYSTKSKLLSIFIPGIVQLDLAFIESITPIYSRQITKAGYPIWGQLELQLKGLIPANINNFENIPTGAGVITR